MMPTTTPESPRERLRASETLGYTSTGPGQTVATGHRALEAGKLTSMIVGGRGDASFTVTLEWSESTESDG